MCSHVPPPLHTFFLLFAHWCSSIIVATHSALFKKKDVAVFKQCEQSEANFFHLSSRHANGGGVELSFWQLCGAPCCLYVVMGKGLRDVGVR